MVQAFPKNPIVGICQESETIIDKCYGSRTSIKVENLIKRKTMKAKQLLTNVMEAKNNTSTKVENLIKKNVKFLDRKIADIERELEDKYDEIEKRLSSETLLDESVVEVLYQRISDLEQKQVLYISFKDEFFEEEI